METTLYSFQGEGKRLQLVTFHDQYGVTLYQVRINRKRIYTSAEIQYAKIRMHNEIKNIIYQSNLFEL